MNKFHMQLTDRPIGAFSGPAIIGSGGMVHVSKVGSPDKATLMDANGNSLANPITLTRGSATFYTANSATPNVDLYGIGPDGQFFRMYNVAPDAMNEIPLDRDRKNQVAVIPFSIADSVAATEKDTGFILPANALVLPDAAILVTTLETTGAKTIDVGLLSSISGGNANGFMVAMDTSGKVLVAAKSAATATRGALLGGSTLDRGMSTDAQTCRNVSYTLVTASVTAKGFIILNYLNMATGAPTL